MGNSDDAIKAAIQGKWEEAVAINREILAVSPSDIDALNRLGKALSELGHLAEARDAYQRVLEHDPNNSIAQRNIQRLSYLKEGEHSPNKEPRGIDSKFFIQETSKAKMITLSKPAAKAVLAKMAAGEEVYLQPKGQKLVVVTDTGEYLGEVESRIGSRLIELMKGGNQYRAAISSVRDENVRVVIREVFQHPSLVGHPSFLPKASEELKPYLKGSLVKHDIEDEFGEETGEAGEWESEEEPLVEDELGVDEEVFPLDKEDIQIT